MTGNHHALTQGSSMSSSGRREVLAQTSSLGTAGVPTRVRSLALAQSSALAVGAPIVAEILEVPVVRDVADAGIMVPASLAELATMSAAFALRWLKLYTTTPGPIAAAVEAGRLVVPAGSSGSG